MFGKFFVITVLVMHESLALHLQAVSVGCQIQFLGPQMWSVVNSVKPPAPGKPAWRRSHCGGGRCVCTPVIWALAWPAALPQAVRNLVTQQECQIILSPRRPPPPVNCHSLCTRACWRVSFCRVATESPHLWGAFWSQACGQYVRCSVSCLTALLWWR